MNTELIFSSTMSFNGGNDSNFPGRSFLPAHLQHLAGLSPQEQLMLQRRFVEAEEQQRLLHRSFPPQFVAASPNPLVS